MNLKNYKLYNPSKQDQLVKGINLVGNTVAKARPDKPVRLDDPT